MNTIDRIRDFEKMWRTRFSVSDRWRQLLLSPRVAVRELEHLDEFWKSMLDGVGEHYSLHLEYAQSFPPNFLRRTRFLGEKFQFSFTPAFFRVLNEKLSEVFPLFFPHMKKVPITWDVAKDELDRHIWEFDDDPALHPRDELYPGEFYRADLVELRNTLVAQKSVRFERRIRLDQRRTVYEHLDWDKIRSAYVPGKDVLARKWNSKTNRAEYLFLKNPTEDVPKVWFKEKLSVLSP